MTVAAGSPVFADLASTCDVIHTELQIDPDLRYIPNTGNQSRNVSNVNAKPVDGSTGVEGESSSREAEANLIGWGSCGRPSLAHIYMMIENKKSNKFCCPLEEDICLGICTLLHAELDIISIFDKAINVKNMCLVTSRGRAAINVL
jgi:hypothetical protein